MALQSGNILVFLDNCRADPAITLTNVKMVIFLPNTTSRLQPLDAGIIQGVKVNYRKNMIQHIAVEIY